MSRHILDRLLFALTIFVGMIGLTSAVFGYGGAWEPVLLGFRTGELEWTSARSEYDVFYNQAGWLTSAAAVVVMLVIFGIRQRIAETFTGGRRGRFDD